MLHPSAGEFFLTPPTASLWIRSDTGGSGGYSTTYLFNPDADGAFRIEPVPVGRVFVHLNG